MDGFKCCDPCFYDLLKQFAKQNRKMQTEAENRLWNHLRNNGIGAHFRRQHIMGDYIADFVCLKSRLIIEIDGGYHSQEEQQERDAYRTGRLESKGFLVMRFTNEEVDANLTFVLDRIYDYVARHITDYKNQEENNG